MRPEGVYPLLMRALTRSLLQRSHLCTTWSLFSRISYSQASGLLWDGEKLSFVLISPFRNRELPYMTWYSHLFVVCLQYPQLFDLPQVCIKPVDLWGPIPHSETWPGSTLISFQLSSTLDAWRKQLIYNSLWGSFLSPQPWDATPGTFSVIWDREKWWEGDGLSWFVIMNPWLWIANLSPAFSKDRPTFE